LIAPRPGATFAQPPAPCAAGPERPHAAVPEVAVRWTGGGPSGSPAWCCGTTLAGSTAWRRPRRRA